MAEWNAARAEELTRYIDGQLDEGELAAFEQRLAADAGLRAEAEELRRVRVRLRSAVLAQPVPEALQERVLARTVNRRWGGWVTSYRGLQLAGALALTVALMVGALFWMQSPEYMLSDLPAEVAAVMQIGIGKHVSCVKERVGSTVFGMGKFQSPVPEEYQRMFDAARRSIPADYKVVEIHMCGTPERQFAHLVVARQDHYVSLLLTPRREGDPEPAAGKYSVATVNGVDIFAAKTGDGLEVSAFALPTQYAFVVSDLDGRGNLALTRDIAGAIQ